MTTTTTINPATAQELQTIRRVSKKRKYSLKIVKPKSKLIKIKY